ncbi:hypothetical protein HRR83_002323 [Exophiala dermatitidis]|uniref:Mitochondrial mRNA processing protein PET127 n=2 Tax=Exophiala dermatitidis TaxID=5970 RepID=H6BXX0_EXODN|nr:uncharacterized protein HMPREF1120_04668 [Exophiala dermatitidis NIH/UT8656]KAJ4520339.1 hypothetical protein HRR75_002204 [Exophiala dermatitidis]EHY56592.1 hypothetical protein HMPREF1120_04668 [Exophiala dermatitidis NIH/UT8656]KAJ4524203.1 hypothetical protein HRR74_002400 [Exophiala dermatitidis]KAJ4525525.1 hypothetical protein HRR73_002255 [Exophiala dermatitidis]KAJ4536842.1 hypothetical protein HRR76_004868 [Exophiala dermatitidis]
MRPFSVRRPICLLCRLRHSNPQRVLPSPLHRVDPTARPLEARYLSSSPDRRLPNAKRPPRAPRRPAKHDATTAPDSTLTGAQKNKIKAFTDFLPLLQEHARTLVPKTAPTVDDLSLEQVLGTFKPKTKALRRTIPTLQSAYAERPFNVLDSDLRRVATLTPRGKVDVIDDETRRILRGLGILQEGGSHGPSKPKASRRKPVPRAERHTPLIRRRLSKGPPLKPSRTSPGDPVAGEDGTRSRSKASDKERIASLDEARLKVAQLDGFALVPVEVARSKVPTLSHDLPRVLFNPGVYQLQDPRSRVWNFDPYLGNIMPVSEFNYDALNRYITSSEDFSLREVASKQGRRYIGSTSSMSGVLAHFHFLLSAWRELTMDNLTRGFKDDGSTFTKIQRGPTAIFLRYKDGVYAVDADKEFDSANILMSLGRSMEKLLTLDKDEYERYRKTHDAEKDSEMHSSEPEAYHYSELGKFLLRSQLDAHDPRLPGTGMFDLKTRAVAAVRMMVHKHEEGAGYQIKERFGTWESFEREYYDMMRSAFLKYSLQVRMGRMDGIFVAYHNTERLFGFQYIPLPELDLALHGQSDPTLGDREFRHSFRLLTDIFDQATAQFPNQSIRFHFEAREATSVQAPHMYIFAEPVTEEEIADIQSKKKEEIEAYERRIFNPKPRQTQDDEWEKAAPEDEDDLFEAETETAKSAGQATATPQTSSATLAEKMASTKNSNAADVGFLQGLMGVNLSANSAPEPSKKQAQASEPAAEEPAIQKPILAWKLNIRNIVNGLPVSRPRDLQPADSWDVEYTLTPFTEVSGQRNYLLCKNRRKAVLEAPQSEDEAVSYYIQQLLSMSQKGAEWRRKLDELDAQRDRVVLYGDRIGADKK